MAVCRIERNDNGAISRVALEGNLNFTPGEALRLTNEELGAVSTKLGKEIKADIKHAGVNGYIDGDKLYIHPDMIGQETPMRSAGILLAGVLKQASPIYYAQIAYEVSKDQALLDRVRNVDTYNFLTTEEQIVDKATSMMLEEYVDELTDIGTLFNIGEDQSIGDMTASEFLQAVATNDLNVNIPEFSYSRGVFRNVVDNSNVTKGKVDDVVEMTSTITHNLARRLGIQVKEYIRKVRYKYTKKDIDRAFLNEQIAILGFAAPGFFDESSAPITLNQPNNDYKAAHERNPKIAKIGVSPNRNPWAIRYLQGGKKGKQFQNSSSAIELDRLIADELKSISERIELTDDFYISAVNTDRLQRELADPQISPERAQMIKYILNNPSEYVKKMAEVQRKDLQQVYYTVMKSRLVPDALKLLMLESIISESYRSNPAKGGIVITKRNKYTESSFSAPITSVMLILAESDVWQSSNKIMEDYLFTLQDNSKKRINLDDYTANVHSRTEEGIWYRFKKDDDTDVISLNHFNAIGYDPSKWCTNSLETARTYLSRGDMFLFFDTNIYDSTIQIAPDSGGEGNGMIAGRGLGETLLDEDYKQVKSLLNTTPEIVEKVKPQYDYLKYKEAVDTYHKFGVGALSREMVATIAESKPSKVDRHPERLEQAKESLFLDKEILAKSIGVNTSLLIDILDDATMDKFWDDKTNTFSFEGTKENPLYLFSSEKDFGNRRHISKMKHVKLLNGYMTIAGFGNLSLEDVDLNSAKVHLGFGDININNVIGKGELYTNDEVKSVVIKDSDLRSATVILSNFENDNYNVNISDSYIGDLTTPVTSGISNLTSETLSIKNTDVSELDFKGVKVTNTYISEIFPKNRAILIKNLNGKELNISPYDGTDVTIIDSNVQFLRNGLSSVHKVTLKNVVVTESIHPDFGTDIFIEDSRIADLSPYRGSNLSVKKSKIKGLLVRGTLATPTPSIIVVSDTTIERLTGRDNPNLKLTNTSINFMNISDTLKGNISIDNLTTTNELYYTRAGGMSDFSFVHGSVYFENADLQHLILKDGIKVNIQNCDVNPNSFDNVKILDNLYVRGYRGELSLKDMEINNIRVDTDTNLSYSSVTMKNIKANSTTIMTGYADISNINGSLYLMPRKEGAVYYVNNANNVSVMGGSIFASGKINYLAAHLEALDRLKLDGSEIELLALDLSKWEGGTPIISKTDSLLHAVMLSFKDEVPGFIYDFFNYKGGIQSVNILELPDGSELVSLVSKLTAAGIENVNINSAANSYSRMPKRFFDQMPATVTYNQGEGRASIIRQDQNSLLIFGNQADATSIIHEKTHEFEQGLTFDEITTVEDWSGFKYGTTEFSEAFAKGAERFLYDGVIEANEATVSIFKKFADWFKSLIEDAINYFADINDLNNGIREIYTRMILRESPTPTEVLSTELQEIKNLSLIDGTYMKAPDGTATKLSEMEWLQTQTEAFKSMYGDVIKAYKVRKSIEYRDENDNRCSMAKDGARGKFHPGSKWEIVKDLKGYPSHAQGGVDIKLGKDGFSFTRGSGQIMAAHGLVLPKIR